MYSRHCLRSQKHHGKESLPLADDLDRLVHLLHREGKLEEAETLCRRALEIRCKSLGEESPAVGYWVANFAKKCARVLFIVCMQTRVRSGVPGGRYDWPSFQVLLLYNSFQVRLQYYGLLVALYVPVYIHLSRYVCSDLLFDVCFMLISPTYRAAFLN